MYLEANSIQFDPLPAGVTSRALTNGRYHDTGAYGPAPFAGAKIYEDKHITFVDVDGVVRVRHGFRGRLIFATLVFAGSLSYCDTTCKQTLDDLMQLERYTVSTPGGSNYDGCCVHTTGQGTWVNMSGGCLLIVPIIFIQLSETN